MKFVSDKYLYAQLGIDRERYNSILKELMGTKSKVRSRVRIALLPTILAWPITSLFMRVYFPEASALVRAGIAIVAILLVRKLMKFIYINPCFIETVKKGGAVSAEDQIPNVEPLSGYKSE